STPSVSPSRLHLEDDPVVVEARALLIEDCVLELQLQVVAREEVLHAPGIAGDAVGARAVIRIELLHAADELAPLGHHTGGANGPTVFHSSLTPTSRLGESESTAMERSGSSNAVDERMNSADSGVFDWPIVAVQSRCVRAR